MLRQVVHSAHCRVSLCLFGTLVPVSAVRSVHKQTLQLARRCKVKVMDMVQASQFCSFSRKMAQVIEKMPTTFLLNDWFRVLAGFPLPPSWVSSTSLHREFQDKSEKAKAWCVQIFCSESVDCPWFAWQHVCHCGPS